MSWGYYDFPKAAPRPKPKPGKSRKKFGATWWGKKWVDVLSKFEYTSQRMSRGRAYARADMVQDFKIKEGSISATVEGSRYYKIVITFDRYNNQEWETILQKMHEIPIILSKLLNNELPEDMDEVTGHSLIPEKFKARCSCPDYANPCKHIAAVFYTIADEIDYDPMILFKLKGMGKGRILKELGIMDDDGQEAPEAEKTKAAAKGGQRKKKTATKKAQASAKGRKTKKKPKKAVRAAAKKKVAKKAAKRQGAR
ncbi:MAG: SWIM zinc finger family protein [Candidatus Woesearchaeota archaeon]